MRWPFVLRAVADARLATERAVVELLRSQNAMLTDRVRELERATLPPAPAATLRVVAPEPAEAAVLREQRETAPLTTLSDDTLARVAAHIQANTGMSPQDALAHARELAASAEQLASGL